MVRGKTLRAVLTLAIVGLLFSATGCGYLKNVRDDALDCGTLAFGVVPPVAPTGDGPKGVGFLPPALGAYLEVTELFHLGLLYKATGDLEWDRRSLGIVVDRRTKAGLGPFHYVAIEQLPVLTTGYKDPQSDLEGWRQHMAELTDPVFHSPAKIMIYEPGPIDLGPIPGLVERTSCAYLSRGWQDWESVSLELAIPEPFLLHSGFYCRVGFDLSQVFDLVLSVFCVDLYDDAAYTMSGELKY